NRQMRNRGRHRQGVRANEPSATAILRAMLADASLLRAVSAIHGPGRGPLCGLKSDIAQGPRSATSGHVMKLPAQHATASRCLGCRRERARALPAMDHPEATAQLE